MTDKIIPTYKFKVVEGEEVTPVKRTIQKTMEVTEEFNVFDALTYIAKMQKEIDNKKAEISGLETMIKAYNDELDLIEKALGVQAEEVTYQKEIAKVNQKELEKQLKEELLKTGNFVEKDEKDNQGN